MRALTTAVLLIVACASGPAVANHQSPRTATKPADVVRAYLESTSTGDLDRATGLMLESSVIFESGADEGSWANYRAHHLGPEIKQIKHFEIRPGELATTTSADESLAVVTLAMEYDITLVDQRRIESKGTATFSLRLVDGHYRIQHVHWSSRRRNVPPH